MKSKLLTRNLRSRRLWRGAAGHFDRLYWTRFDANFGCLMAEGRFSGTKIIHIEE